MRTLKLVELNEISGGMASFFLDPDEGLTFMTTGGSINHCNAMINGIWHQMVIYSDHVTDLIGNTLYKQTEGGGEFCSFGNHYIVSPIDSGLKIIYIGVCP